MALKVIAGEFVGSAHFVAIVFMQLSNVSPSDGANDAFWYAPLPEKLADTASETVRAYRPVFFLSACS